MIEGVHSGMVIGGFIQAFRMASYLVGAGVMAFIAVESYQDYRRAVDLGAHEEARGFRLGMILAAFWTADWFVLAVDRSAFAFVSLLAGYSGHANNRDLAVELNIIPEMVFVVTVILSLLIGGQLWAIYGGMRPLLASRPLRIAMLGSIATTGVVVASACYLAGGWT